MLYSLTLDGGRVGLDDAAIAGLRGRLRGSVILASDGDYDAARRVWNGNVDRRPALIVRSADAHDAAQAIDFARTHALLLSVRGGGHSAPGYGVNDGGMVLDLSLMRQITVDPARQIARVHGGALWLDLDAATQAHGLAVTGGTVSNTGVGGLTLGGGIGWLGGLHGATVDNLISAEVVTADGKLRRVSERQEPDLFWALRGGGGNFGVVTEFEFQLHPVGQVLGGMVLHPLDQARDALRFYRDFVPTLPDAAEAHAGLLAPEGTPMLALLMGYNGPIEEGERVFAPLRQFGTPSADLVRSMSYGERQVMLDEPNAVHGLQRYWRSAFTETLSDALIDEFIAAARSFSSPMNALLMFYVHGSICRRPPSATAFAARSPQWDIDAIGCWTDPAESETHIAWVRAMWSRFEPHLLGRVYANHITGDDSPEKVRASFGENHARLRRVKAAYDPGNLFRINSNITPADAA
ncbi:MAG: FAD-binding oxidoreductase [Phenylobacterium sp.]|uniref:FAD-binding oxidoreductase n=1 Tax=Phenylobacterium sp. TaxID=1871053 RepID=UPI0011F4BFD1|nr:FAD-binding oxidoreductase [Phenylobacterium sp.]TAL28855.1 MAG: FAD-binding oxidoreductase [Phenylobacterium sp.]